jgi:hypothetical protein
VLVLTERFPECSSDLAARFLTVSAHPHHTPSLHSYGGARTNALRQPHRREYTDHSHYKAVCSPPIQHFGIGILFSRSKHEVRRRSMSHMSTFLPDATPPARPSLLFPPPLRVPGARRGPRGGLRRHDREAPGVARADGGVGTLVTWTILLQSNHHFMTAGMVHVTNLNPPGSDNPRRAYGGRHQLMTAGMVHVTNLTPGSGVTTLRDAAGEQG